MKPTAIITLIAAMLTLASGCTQGDKKIKLTLKWEPGMTLDYEQVTKRSFKAYRADSLVSEGFTTYSIKVAQEVKNVGSDGIADVIESSAWTIVRPGKEDSAVMDTSTYEREMILKIKPNGKIVDFSFAKEEETSSAAYVKNYYEQGIPVFPSVEMSPGKEWTQETRVVLPEESLEASTTYRIKSLAREAGYDCALIEYEGNLVIPIVPDTKDSVWRAGIDRVSSTGIMYFAYKEGVVVLQRERWVIDGERRESKGADTVQTRIASEVDSEYVLKKRAFK
ncbi:MAG: hypothetical protein OEW00_03070 [candidate division Zixibacteria bacterium]|nr:hypothetical protein [candidate division Zixibacteria bacterium]